MFLSRIYNFIIGSVIIFICRHLPLKKRIIITSTNNDSFNFNSKPFFEYLLKEGFDEYEIFYVMNDSSKRDFLNQTFSSSGTKYFIDGEVLRHKIDIARSRIWISSAIDIPLNSFLYDKRRIALHLGHGVPLKKIGLDEMNMSLFQRVNRTFLTRAFTDVVCYSDSFESIFRRIFGRSNIRFLKYGQPRNDYLKREPKAAKISLIMNLSEMHGMNVDRKFVLYAPTWRPYSKTILFPFKDVDYEKLNYFLEKNKITIFIRSHPYYKAHLPSGFNYNKNIIDLNNHVVSDITEFLCAFDFLVTDYSSIYFDFLCTGGKIIFTPYDLEEYQREVGISFDFSEFAPGDKVFDIKEFCNALVADKDQWKCQRAKMAMITNTKPEGNCLEVYNYLKCLMVEKY